MAREEPRVQVVGKDDHDVRPLGGFPSLSRGPAADQRGKRYGEHKESGEKPPERPEPSRFSH